MSTLFAAWRRFFAPSGPGPALALGLVSLALVLWIAVSQSTRLVGPLLGILVLQVLLLLRRWLPPARPVATTDPATAPFSLANLVDYAPNPMLLLDERGRIRMANRPAEQLTGYSNAELSDQIFASLLPDRPDPALPGFRHINHTDQMLRRKDGSNAPVEISIGPDGTMLAALIDLTERHAAETRFRMLVEASPTAILLVNTQGRIVLVNGQSEDLFGYARTEMLGQPIEMLMNELDQEGHARLRSDYVRTPTSRRMGKNRDLYARHKTGRAIPVEVGLSPIVVGNETLIQAAVVDISLRKQTEQHLREQAEQLSQASRYKSEFLANMSHELRTPLNSILILSEQLRNNRKGNLDERQVMHADLINRSGTDLTQLINDILDLSKVEAGLMRVVPELIDLGQLVSDLCDTFRPQAQTKGIELHCNVASNVPRLIHSDPQRLSQILKNLLANALKFTEQGSVRLDITRAEPAKPPQVPDNASLAFRVSDTGIGIPADKQALIFEAFQQIDGSTSRRFGGTGLGLTICRQLAELLGGAITVNSQMGVGSLFTLYLPSQEQDDTAAPSTPRGTASSRPHELAPPERREVLIVEDNPQFAEILRDNAEQFGLVPVVCSDGQSALHQLQERQFLAVLLDLLLPDISGWHILYKINQQPPERRPPVHILSCVTPDVNWESHAASYLVKPVAASDLSALFRQIASGYPATKLALLLVEDDPVERDEYLTRAKTLGLHSRGCATMTEAIGLYRAQHFDLLVIDAKLPDGSGIELLDRLDRIRPLAASRIILHTNLDPDPEQSAILARHQVRLVGKTDSRREALVQALRELILQLQTPPAEPCNEPLRRLLLVDDDERNCYALSLLLEGMGFAVDLAHNGREGVELAQTGDYALILMDISMPIMDGYEAIRILKQQMRLETPIIALTARAMSGDHDKCLAAGADDYVSKPVTSSKLAQALSHWLDKTPKE
ncbi:response regulator [Chitinimonas lacunae]|uniref:histidine kinase n=1 Tax=Chitinimonas lacunae TaxID=1963018 RepID=A0ABV8MND5_9NEIS